MNDKIFDKKKSFTLAVKNNLRAFLSTADYIVDEYGSFTRTDDLGIKHLTLTELCNCLEKKSMREGNSFKLNKLEDKLKKTLSDENDSLDPYFINEICQLYGFPIQLVYRTETKFTPEEAETVMAELKKGENLSSDFSVPLSPETHHAYFGEFYGYTFDHNTKEKDRLIEFTLNVFLDEQNLPKAEYSFRNRNGDEQLFIGVPRFIPHLKSMYIEMTANNNKRFQYLYFNAPDYKANKKIVYKNGVCVRTSSTSRNHEPDAKSFIITGKKLPKETAEAIVPGLLKLCGDEFYVLKSSFDDLCANDSKMVNFCKAYSNEIRFVDGAVYLVKERRILDELFYESEKDVVMGFECLAKLKNRSLAPNKAVFRVHDTDYSYFNLLSFEERK